MSDESLKTAIKTVKSGVLIEDVIGRFIKLEKAGVYLKGKCPLPPDLSHPHGPSYDGFTVTPHKQIFYCFGCHRGGDSILFIGALKDLSPIDAVDYIKKEFLDKENSCARMADEQ